MTQTYPADSAPRESGKDLDVVLFGATGFVGAICAAELARTAPEGLRVGLAGRSAKKLEKVKAELPQVAREWEVVVADASHPEALDAMVARSHVIMTTVGPYATYGMPLAQACAKSGTHYVDLTGEVLYARDVIDTCHEAATKSGARIINSCGFDSVPSDLGVWLLDQTVQADQAGTLGDTTLYASMRGGMSGGTIASAMAQADAIHENPARRKVAGDRFALSPERSKEPSGEFRDSLAVWFSKDVGAWVAPFLMASYNTRIVRRSNALLNHAYGPDFRYREVMKCGQGVAGRAQAYLVSGALAAGFTALSVRQIRPLVEKIVPSAGQGPSEKSRENGFFKMDIRTRTTTGAHYRSVVAAQGDPGYKATAVMLVQAALTLAHDSLPALPNGEVGGVVTPAIGLGMPYIERLRGRGFTVTAGPVGE